MKYITLLVLSIFLFAATVSGQRGDYMTPSEQDVVRNNQDIDARIAVLSYMVDRRLIAMGLQTKANKPSPGPDAEWGPEPAGTKPELLFDIRHLIEKAIDDIDNIASRPALKSAEEKNGVNIFNKAVRSLSASAKRWLPILKKEFENAADEQTHSAAATAIGFCEQIIEAASKLK